MPFNNLIDLDRLSRFLTKVKDLIPTKLSELTNDGNFVSDANYVHTANNYTTAEKNKLAGIAAGAQVNAVTSVNGKTGAVNLTASDVNAVPTSDRTVLHIGPNTMAPDGTLVLPKTPTGANATQKYYFALPDEATLIGVLLSSGASAVELCGWYLSQADKSVLIRAYDLSSAAGTITWSMVYARAVYVI